MFKWDRHPEMPGLRRPGFCCILLSIQKHCVVPHWIQSWIARSALRFILSPDLALLYLSDVRLLTPVPSQTKLFAKREIHQWVQLSFQHCASLPRRAGTRQIGMCLAGSHTWAGALSGHSFALQSCKRLQYQFWNCLWGTSLQFWSNTPRSPDTEGSLGFFSHVTGSSWGHVLQSTVELQQSSTSCVGMERHRNLRTWVSQRCPQITALKDHPDKTTPNNEHMRESCNPLVTPCAWQMAGFLTEILLLKGKKTSVKDPSLRVKESTPPKQGSP